MWNQVKVIDGGMGTELVRCGVEDVDKHKLWSALANVDFPDSVVQAHKNFIDAGADVIISNTYQSNQPLLMSELQISREEADNLLFKTVDLARKAAESETIVAGSIGPFPDCPASEYDPQYLKRMSFEELYNWHLPRFELLAKSPKIDILACETMPGLIEARVMLKLLSEFKKEAYISFACQKGRTNAGEPFAEIVKTLQQEAPDNLKGIGINCSEPEIVEEFGALMKANFPDLTLVCYPNTGETWTNNAGEWEVEASQWGGSRAARHTRSYSINMSNGLNITGCGGQLNAAGGCPCGDKCKCGGGSTCKCTTSGCCGCGKK